MENRPPEISPAETQAENKIEPALVHRSITSMLAGGGGRFQLLTGLTVAEAAAPAGATGIFPANAEN